jgi:hypothetical protein
MFPVRVTVVPGPMDSVTVAVPAVNVIVTPVARTVAPVAVSPVLERVCVVNCAIATEAYPSKRMICMNVRWEKQLKRSGYGLYTD